MAARIILTALVVVMVQPFEQHRKEMNATPRATDHPHRDDPPEAENVADCSPRHAGPETTEAPAEVVRGCEIPFSGCLNHTFPVQFFASRITSLNGLVVSKLGSRGKPRTRSPIALRWTSFVPPAMDGIRPFR